jgi:hypothetical protein
MIVALLAAPNIILEKDDLRNVVAYIHSLKGND